MSLRHLLNLRGSTAGRGTSAAGHAAHAANLLPNGDPPFQAVGCERQILGEVLIIDLRQQRRRFAGQLLQVLQDLRRLRLRQPRSPVPICERQWTLPLPIPA